MLHEYRDIKLINFNPRTMMKQAFFNRTVVRLRDTLELRINAEVYKNVITLWNFMTTRQVDSGGS